MVASASVSIRLIARNTNWNPDPEKTQPSEAQQAYISLPSSLRSSGSVTSETSAGDQVTNDIPSEDYFTQEELEERYTKIMTGYKRYYQQYFGSAYLESEKDKKACHGFLRDKKQASQISLRLLATAMLCWVAVTGYEQDKNKRGGMGRRSPGTIFSIPGLYTKGSGSFVRTSRKLKMNFPGWICIGTVLRTGML